MATINFPANPSTNDTYNFGGKSWVYNGSAWDLSTTAGINGIPIGATTPSTGAFTTLTATSSVSATGNITGGNVTTAGLVSATGNITGGNILTSGLVSVTGNISSAANISASGNVIATANIYSNNVIVPNQDQVLAYIFAF